MVVKLKDSNVRGKPADPHIKNLTVQLREGYKTNEALAKAAKVSRDAINKACRGFAGPGVVIALARAANPPLCWAFLSAAGITLKVIQKKLQEYAVYLDAEGASKQLRHLELELEHLQAQKDREEKLRGRKGGDRNVALKEQSHTHKKTS